MSKEEREMIAHCALMQHVMGDYKALYESVESFNDLWGYTWFEYEADPRKKIEEWLRAHDQEITRVDNAIWNLVCKEVRG